MRTRNYKDSAIGLSLLTSAPVKTVNNGKKICRWDGCSKRLSQYNPNDYCFAHALKGAIKDDDAIQLDKFLLSMGNKRMAEKRRNARNYRKRKKERQEREKAEEFSPHST